MRKSRLDKVAYIVDNVPSTRYNKKLLIVTYWKLFNDIDIPDDVARQIIEKADEPETIMRSARKLFRKLDEGSDLDENEQA